MLETDAELRERLLYIVGEDTRVSREIHVATGEALDAIAYNYDLKRRRTRTEPLGVPMGPYGFGFDYSDG